MPLDCLQGRKQREATVQGYLAHEEQPPASEYHRTLGIVLLEGPRRGVFIVSEVPLYHGAVIAAPCAMVLALGSSHIMLSLISFRKSTSPQNRQLIVYYY